MKRFVVDINSPNNKTRVTPLVGIYCSYLVNILIGSILFSAVQLL